MSVWFPFELTFFDQQVNDFMTPWFYLNFSELNLM